MKIEIFFTAHFLILLTGWLWLGLIDPGQQFRFGLKFAAAWFVGGGLTTLIMLVWLALGQATGLGNWMIIIAGQIILLSIMIKIQQKKWWWLELVAKIKTSSSQPGQIKRLSYKLFKEKINIFAGLMFLLIIARVILAFWQTAHIPTYEFDGWNNWNLRAKVISIEQKLPLLEDDQFFLGGGIHSYPLHLSLFKIYLNSWSGSGQWSEPMVNSLSAVTYIFLLLIFYNLLPDKFPASSKIIATAFLSGLPFLNIHAWVAYADLLFAAYVFISLICWLKLISSGHRSYLILSAICLALSGWTKNEGWIVLMPIIILLTLVALLSKQLKLKIAIQYWLWVLLTSAPWLAFRLIMGLPWLSGDSANFSWQINYQFLGQWFDALFLQSNFIFIYFLFFWMFFWHYKYIKKYIYFKILTYIIIILLIYNNSIILLTDRALDLGALVRINLHIVPLMFYAIVVVLTNRYSDIFIQFHQYLRSDKSTSLN